MRGVRHDVKHIHKGGGESDCFQFKVLWKFQILDERSAAPALDYQMNGHARTKPRNASVPGLSFLNVRTPRMEVPLVGGIGDGLWVWCRPGEET